jgi:DNA-binding CsgD family transcriptional regulator
MIDGAALRIADIATSPGPVPERAEALLEELGRHIRFDASWVALAQPDGTGYTSLASTSLDEGTLGYLRGPKMARDIELTGTDRAQPPLSLSDLPYPSADLQTWAECLLPSGFREGLGVALFGPGGRHVGFLAILFAGAEPPSSAMRRRMSRLLPVITHGVDPVRSIAIAALVVHGASAGVVLLPTHGYGPLPGLPDDELLTDGPDLLDAARAAIGDGQLCVSFLWPRADRRTPGGHVRVTVMRSGDDVSSVLAGVVILSPAKDLHGLTPRELQVLGLLIDGCSNQEIARELVVAPRTVAAHLEHILVKLQAESRTLAAVRAERAGLYVPAARPRPT